MSRSPSAVKVSDALQNRMPYTDPPFAEQHDPYEISLGYGHCEISHLLTIIFDQKSKNADKLKALRLLADVVPGRQDEAIQQNALEVLVPLIDNRPNGILLNTLIVLERLIVTNDHALNLVPSIEKITEFIGPEIEIPIRSAATDLLLKIGEFTGPVQQFMEDEIPIRIITSAADKETPVSILKPLFNLLAVLANNQAVRIPLIENEELMKKIVSSISNPELIESTIRLCSSVSMDNSHKGKLALLDSGILPQLAPQLETKDIDMRFSILSLLCLLSVPKEGKEKIAMCEGIPERLKEIASSDPDLQCRRAADKCRVIVAELPVGRAVIGDVKDPSKPQTAKKQIDMSSQDFTREDLNTEVNLLLFITRAVFKTKYGVSVQVAHSLGDGVYCYPYHQTDFDPDELYREIKAVTDKDPMDITFLNMSRDSLIEKFAGMHDKLGILKAWNIDPYPCVQYKDYVDYVIQPMAHSFNKITEFSLVKYDDGFIVRFPTLTYQNGVKEWEDPKAQLDMFKEYTNWAKICNVDTIAKLNEMIVNSKVEELKWTAEGLHSKKLSMIADTLCEGFKSKRVVTIAGPSSSNKTTFAKRLAIAIKTNGFDSIVIEMDDYFKDREDTPKDENGNYDFECIGAMNLEALSNHVHALLRGETVHRRKFDFKRGIGYESDTETLSLGTNKFLILEGIHGLDPELLNYIGRDDVVPIYVAPLTPLSIDYGHRFSTTDLRLIRRIIRDNKFRGHSARRTIAMWTSVRLGEEKNIFPYQPNAQMFFNSSLVYELPVLSVLGRVILTEATVPAEDEDPSDPKTKAITKEARRLLNLLNLFYPISSEDVPHISCIREFIGGSDLKY